MPSLELELVLFPSVELLSRLMRGGMSGCWEAVVWWDDCEPTKDEGGREALGEMMDDGEDVCEVGSAPAERGSVGGHEEGDGRLGERARRIANAQRGPSRRASRGRRRYRASRSGEEEGQGKRATGSVSTNGGGGASPERGERGRESRWGCRRDTERWKQRERGTDCTVRVGA